MVCYGSLRRALDLFDDERGAGGDSRLKCGAQAIGERAKRRDEWAGKGDARLFAA